MRNKNDNKAVHIKLAEMSFDNIHNVKIQLKLDSYDSAAVVLRIAAASGVGDGGGGISEAQLSSELDFTRATMNRIVNRLIDTRHIVVVSGTSPRRFEYNFEFLNLVYGDSAVSVRSNLANEIIEGSISTLLTIFKIWQSSQFEIDG